MRKASKRFFPSRKWLRRQEEPDNKLGFERAWRCVEEFGDEDCGALAVTDWSDGVYSCSNPSTVNKYMRGGDGEI